MRSIYFFIVLFITVSTSCQQDQDQVVIGISFETLQSEYWVTSIETMKQECEKNGVGYHVAVANGDAYRQYDQVNNFISLGVDGIIVAPKDGHTVIPIIKMANRANVPIVIYNRQPAKTMPNSVTVVADNYEISKQTVRYMGTLARETQKLHKAIILIGDLGDINAINRRRGFNDAVREFPEVIEVVAEVPTEWNQEKALAGLTNALQANPDVNFVFTSSDLLFPSIISALKNANKYHKIGNPNHVILGGFDGDAMAYDMLKERYLDADGVQDVFFESKSSVQAILDMLDGKTVENTLIDPGFVIHQGNFNELSQNMWGATVNRRNGIE